MYSKSIYDKSLYIVSWYPMCILWDIISPSDNKMAGRRGGLEPCTFIRFASCFTCSTTSRQSRQSCSMCFMPKMSLQMSVSCTTNSSSASGLPWFTCALARPEASRSTAGFTGRFSLVIGISLPYAPIVRRYLDSVTIKTMKLMQLCNWRGYPGPTRCNSIEFNLLDSWWEGWVCIK